MITGSKTQTVALYDHIRKLATKIIIKFVKKKKSILRIPTEFCYNKIKLNRAE